MEMDKNKATSFCVGVFPSTYEALSMCASSTTGSVSAAIVDGIRQRCGGSVSRARKGSDGDRKRERRRRPLLPLQYFVRYLLFGLFLQALIQMLINIAHLCA